MASTGRFGEADLGFAVEDDVQVPDHGGGLQQRVSHLLVAAPSSFYGEGNCVNIDETVTAGTRWNADCFAHVADCRHRSLEHSPLLIAVEVIEPVGVADKFGNETVGQGHDMRLPGRPTGVNRRPAAWASGCGFTVLL